MRFSHRWPEALLFAVMSLVVLLAVAAATPLWRRLDDMAREAHATAWYWGGSAGLGIGLVCLIALYGVRSQMFQGAALVALLEVAGYGLCWLGWWAMRRSREA
jgi:ACR3 family arsenite efflux pump ArsB